IAVWHCVLGDKLEQLARVRRNSSLFDGVSLSALARYRLCYLAVYASAALFRVDPGRNGVKFTCKGGKCAGRIPTRCMSRESDEEGKGCIDHILLAGLAAPSPLAKVLSRASGLRELFQRGEDVGDLNSVVMYRPENARTPKCVPGDWMPAQPLNLLGE